MKSDSLSGAEILLEDSGAVDSMAIDSMAADTIPIGEAMIPLTLKREPEGISAPLRPATSQGGSWVILMVLAMVFVVASRYKSNVKYLKIMIHDLTNVRERGNIFDDTANETTFMFLLTLLCAVAGGLMLFTGLHTFGIVRVDSDTFPQAVWGCIAATAIYCVVMPVVYRVVGMVFTSPLHTSLWVKGFIASQALLGILLLGPALMALFYPTADNILIIIALVLIGVIKLLFITKTFRFFFGQFSSWLVFLYYLCTLEILPLVLTYNAAVRFAG